MSRRGVIPGVLAPALLALGLGACGGASDVGERPDVVLVVVDTLRADHLSLYGYARPTSPELERLGREARVYERALAASTWTLPSTATLLTGLLPAQHGLLSIHQRLPAEVDTLAERLGRAGYRTVAFTDGGFVAGRWGFGQGFERYEETAGEPWVPKDVAPIAAAARDFLAREHDRPFFLFLHTYETHKPYVNPEGFADPFLDPSYRGRFRKEGNFFPLDPGEIDERDRERLVALYDGEVRRADHYLGRVFDALRASGRWERTAILVTSDHGEEFLEHGDLEHGFGKVFDENVRVPLLLKPPGESAGRRIATAVSGLDVVPTLLELAGLEPDPALPGRSLLAPAAGRAVAVHGTNSFPEIEEERLRLDEGPAAVVLDRVRGRAEWYDLEADPEMRVPRNAVFDGRAGAAARRLQALLGWSRSGHLLARLPSGGRRLAAPATSRVAPAGVWNGLEWRPAEETGEVPLDPGVPQVLVFATRRGEAWEIEIERVAAPEAFSLRASRSARGWNPLADALPEPGLLVVGARAFTPDAAELDAASVEELRALGYLQ